MPTEKQSIMAVETKKEYCLSDFSSKISHVRFHASRVVENGASFPAELEGEVRRKCCNVITYQCESDRGRIINSAAVRRLQQKTQVFPLERNAAVRSRLTHSLEVMQVGRFIARKLISELKKNDDHKVHIEGLEDALESIVEMSCLMHDVGNPPFGHFGERAIQDWLKSHLSNCIYQSFECRDLHELSSCVAEKLMTDLTNFEGNAQGIRLITRLQKLNLTKTQIASVLKYTRCGIDNRPDDSAHPLYYLLKKVGYYYSEKPIVDEVTRFHGLQEGHRHPVAYIMEAADDISYCIADLEDAVDKNILTMEGLKSLLLTEYGKLFPECLETCQCPGNVRTPACQRMQGLLSSNEGWSTHDAEDVSQFFIALRSNFIVTLVNYASKIIFENLNVILDGSYSGHVLEDNSYQARMAKAMKNVAVNHVFSHREVEANELKGYTVITGLLDKYKPLLEASYDTFTRALAGERNVPVLLSRLCKKLPPKHLKAYREALDPESGVAELFSGTREKEYYFRCRLIQDLISGMTDQYALDEYRELMALEAV